jgi:hypothetical protein
MELLVNDRLAPISREERARPHSEPASARGGGEPATAEGVLLAELPKTLLEDSVVTFFCTIWNRDGTFGEGMVGRQPGKADVTLVGTARVRAGSRRAAAAKGYVRCVGRGRARLLKDVLEAPPALIQQEIDWRAIAPGLMRSSGRLGDCYCFDNLVETWYITVEPTASPSPSLPSRHPSRLSPSLWHSLLHPLPN